MTTFIAVELRDAAGNRGGARHINLDQIVIADTINPSGLRGAADVTLKMVDGTELKFSGPVAESVVVAITAHMQNPIDVPA